MKKSFPSRIRYLFKTLRECYKGLAEKRQCLITQEELEEKGIEIVCPFSISDKTLLLCESPVYIGPDATLHLRAPLKIGKGTIIGPRLTVHTANHCYEGEALPYDEYYEAKEVTIGNNVWIGDNVTLLPGIRIGDGAVIGANSLVSKDVPSMAIAGGNPCKVIKYRDADRYKQNMESGNIYLTMKREGKTETDENKRIRHYSKQKSQ